MTRPARIALAGFILGTIFGAAVIVFICCVNHVLFADVGAAQIRDEAVRLGAARWEIDQNGEEVFVWNE